VNDGVVTFPSDTQKGTVTFDSETSFTTEEPYQMFQMTSNPVTVMPGSCLWFSLHRMTTTDTNLTIIRETAILDNIES
jgi:hypothetical protein